MSDRAIKENFQKIDARVILDKVAAPPIDSWRLHCRGQGRGPHGARLAGLPRRIRSGYERQVHHVDRQDRVALLAIQGLNARHEDQAAQWDREIAELRDRIAAMEMKSAELAVLKLQKAELTRERTVTAMGGP
jgi:hypothetical protein